MDITFLPPRPSRDAAGQGPHPGVQASTFRSIPAPGMTFGTRAARGDRTCENQVESLVDLSNFRLDNAAPEHRLILPRCGFSNTER